MPSAKPVSTNCRHRQKVLKKCKLTKNGRNIPIFTRRYGRLYAGTPPYPAGKTGVVMGVPTEEEPRCLVAITTPERPQPFGVLISPQDLLKLAL